MVVLFIKNTLTKFFRGETMGLIRMNDLNEFTYEKSNIFFILFRNLISIIQVGISFHLKIVWSIRLCYLENNICDILIVLHVPQSQKLRI